MQSIENNRIMGSSMHEKLVKTLDFRDIDFVLRVSFGKKFVELNFNNPQEEFNIIFNAEDFDYFYGRLKRDNKKHMHFLRTIEQRKQKKVKDENSNHN